MVDTYKLSKSIPNKFLNPDGSITDFKGNVIMPANDGNARAYANSKSIVNKFLDFDGTEKTFAQISMDVFITVDVLPDVGEKNKIYLVPSKDGMFDEYYWNDNGKWDKIGELTIDLSNYPTITQMENYVDNSIKTAITDTLGGAY